MIAAGFVLGEVFALQMKMAGMTAQSIVMAALGAAWFAVQFLQTKGRGLKRLLPFCAVMAGVGLGFLTAEKQISSLDGQEKWVLERSGPIALSGRLDKLETSENGWEFWITDIRDEDGRAGPERLAVRMDELEKEEEEKLCIGMSVSVTGYLSPIEGARNPGEFDYRLYQLSRGITGQIQGEKCRVLDRKSIPYRNFLLHLRKKWSVLLGEICPTKEAGLFRSALLGEKKSLDPQIRELYQKSGIAHLLAISGLHLSILGMGFYKGLKRAGASIEVGAVLACVLVLSYGELIGAFGSAKRAVFMMICGFFADICRRTYDPLTALGLAAVYISWEYPYQLLQSGFQLSFGAVLGICLLGISGKGKEKEKQKERQKPKEKAKKDWLGRCLSGLGKSMKDGMAVSLAVQAATLPIVAFHFFKIPVYGMFLNLIVIPLMAYVLYFGIAGIVLGSGAVAAGAAALWPGSRILDLYEGLSIWVSSLPGNQFLVGRPDWEEILVYYVCLLVGRYAAGTSVRRLWILLAAAVLSGPLLLKYQPASGLSITCLDVGQGDGIVFQSGDTVILVDGGSTDQKNLGTRTLTPFLESRAIGEINYAIVSHGDNDHISGLKTLMEEQTIKVSCLLLPAHGKGQEIYEELEALAKAQNGQVFYIGQNDSIREGKEGLSLTCLYPAVPGKDQKLIEERNDHSLVMRAEYGTFSMILTGDLGSSGEEDMLSKIEIPKTVVLKAGHHGSRESSSPRFLEGLNLQMAVISCGRENSYGHPHKETIERLKERGIEIWITAESGAVEFWTDGERLKQNVWK